MHKAFIAIFFFLVILGGPLWVLLTQPIGLAVDWRIANRDSARIASSPTQTPEALVQIYASRADTWRGVFSLHTWIAAKAVNAKQYEVYQVIGWRVFQGLPVVMITEDVPDRYWFGQKPRIIAEIRGQTAERAIIALQKWAIQYPYNQQYVLWPGPNSNTFTAFAARHIPELHIALPSNAVGKDYLGFPFFARAPSNTGWQFSFYGLLGVMLAKEEGLEINFLGLVFGIDFVHLGIKLPAVGLLSFLPKSH